MYITINDIIGSKTIDLSYPIKGREGSSMEQGTKGPCGPRTPLGSHVSAEIAVISMFSDNVQYWLKGHLKVQLKSGKEIMLNKVAYMDKELNELIGLELKSQMIDSQEDVLRTNKLEKVTKMVTNLEELNNSDNLEDGRPRNTLFTYYVTGPEYSTCFKPVTPQYKALKSGMITSLILKITDQTGNIITNGPETIVVLHIKYNPL